MSDDADSYADDLPYWAIVNGKPHLVVPYTLDTNDMRLASAGGFATGMDWESHCRDAFDLLWREGEEGSAKNAVDRPARADHRPTRASSSPRTAA
jgi:peptidoglycan/xylan/chitin deacetylase (PgdA/CDA1 family)